MGNFSYKFITKNDTVVIQTNERLSGILSEQIAQSWYPAQRPFLIMILKDGTQLYIPLNNIRCFTVTDHEI